MTPQKCHATLLKHPQSGVLAFVSNLGRNAQTVSVVFDLERLGLSGQQFDVFNALTGEPMTLSADGTMSVSLESEDWVYVWLRPRASEKHEPGHPQIWLFQ